MKPVASLQFRILTAMVLAVLIAVYFWIQHFISNEYTNLSELNAQQNIEGFVPIGRFGTSWPASIVEIREQDDRIEFTRQNGQPHIYQGFEGYRLRVVRLESRSGAEVIVVYRSETVDTISEIEQSDRPIVRKI